MDIWHLRRVVITTTRRAINSIKADDIVLDMSSNQHNDALREELYLWCDLRQVKLLANT